jgi:xanthine dehydrogenase accessory factor
LALSRVLSQLGYHTTLIDTRADCPTIVENLYADEIRIIDDFSDAANAITQHKLQHVVVMTADGQSDLKALLGISKVGHMPFVGVMGSPAKIRKIFKSLKDEGVSDDFVNSIRAPVGLRIKSNKPEEIAISVAAEFLQLREELFPYNKWSAAPREN